MALTKLVLDAIVLVAGVRAQDTPVNVTTFVCPPCYTHTVIVYPPWNACPTPPPPHIPVCDVVCTKRWPARKIPARDAGEAVAAHLTITTTHVTTTTAVSTVTATVPGHNPACPTTATLTITRARDGDAESRGSTASPDPVCSSAYASYRQCACDGTEGTATVVVTQTVSALVTAFVTAEPLVCMPLLMPTPAPHWPEDQATLSTSLSASQVCKSYTTKWEMQYCLDGLAAGGGPQTAMAPIGPRSVRRDVPVETVTRGCSVYLISKPTCVSRGV